MYRARNNPALPAHVVDAILKQYRNGLTPENIAKLLNVNKVTVYNYLDKAGVSREKKESITADEIKKIAELYSSGMEVQEIQESTGRALNSITRLLDDLGLKKIKRIEGTGIDRFTEEQIHHIREMWAAGSSADEVGEYLGISGVHAYRILDQAGVDTSVKPMSDQEKALAVNLYNEGLSCKKIGERLGIHGNTVNRLLRQLSVPMRAAGGRQVVTEDQLREASYLREGGASLADLAKQFGMSVAGIRKSMIKAGLYVSKGKASNKEKDEVRKRYEGGESIASIAKEFEVEPSVIIAALQGMGVTIDPVRGNPRRGRRR